MSKLFVLAAALIAANTASAASAASIELEQACGKLKVEKRVCITAPCFQGYQLLGRGEPLVLNLQKNAELNDYLSVRNGQQVCVEGISIANGVFAVYGVSE